MTTELSINCSLCGKPYGEHNQKELTRCNQILESKTYELEIMYYELAIKRLNK